MTRRTKVLVVDDSALVRQVLSEIISSDPELELLGAAADPFLAAERMKRELPDVITLDVEMPRMDGLSFLRRIMSQHPLPVVMCSSLTTTGSEAALRALEYGAVDIIEKPRLGAGSFLQESRIRICDTIKAAAQARVRRRLPQRDVAPKLTADAVIAAATPRSMFRTTEKVVVVGASTGGTEALRVLLQGLPADAPGMVVVQHMPELFTAAFAQRLDSLCRVSVKEAADNDTIIPGRVLIAPGNRHTLVCRSGARYYVEVKEGPLVCRHRPSVDVLFRSAARFAGPNAIGVIMTGMGDDGARGMAELKAAGAATMAQDEATCVIFGMPAEAIRRGGVDVVLPLDALAPRIIRCARS